MKNIPVPTQQSYKKVLMDKIESFIRRMRWKAHFHENPNHQNSSKETFGFSSSSSPPQVELLKPFESDLYEMYRNLEFKRSLPQFQRKLAEDAMTPWKEWRSH